MFQKATPHKQSQEVLWLDLAEVRPVTDSIHLSDQVVMLLIINVLTILQIKQARYIKIQLK